MAKGRLVSVEARHIDDLARNISPADRAEIEAFDYTPYDAIESSVHGSIEAFAWEINGRVACLFGVCQSLDVLGPVHPWMLTTPLLRSDWRFFARSSKRVVEAWAERYPHMKNYVDARHTVAIHWLKWLGFVVSRDATLIGSKQVPFHAFEMVNSNASVAT